jgi:hypothetical protein
MYVSPLTILCVAGGVIAILLLAGVEIAWGRHLRRSFRNASGAGLRPARIGLMAGRKPAPRLPEVNLRFPAA